MFYHVRLAACHDLTLRYLLVSVSLGGKSISLRRYCENCEIHQRASNRGHARYAPCVANTTRAFRTIDFPFLRSISLVLSSSFPFFLLRSRTASHLDFNRKAGIYAIVLRSRLFAREFYYPRTR